MYQAKLNTAYAIASYAGKKKKEFANTIRAGNDETAILRIPANEILALAKYQFYCSDCVVKNSTALFDFEKLQKDKLFIEWLNGCGYVENSDNLIMTFRICTTLFVLHKAEAYEGCGGIFIRDKHKTAGFVIQPLKNWLTNNFPQDTPEAEGLD